MQLTTQQERKLKKLAKLFDEGNVAVLEHLFEIEEKIDADMEKIRKEHAEMYAESTKSKLPPELVAKIKQLKGDKGDKGEDAKVDYKYIIREVLNNIRVPEDGKDGKDAVIDYNKVITDVLKRIKVPEVDYDRVIEDVLALIRLPEAIKGDKGEDGSPDSGEEIITKINESPEEYKIDASKIKNLPEPKVQHFGGGSISVIKELVAGTNISIDNTNTQYPVISSTGGGGGVPYTGATQDLNLGDYNLLAEGVVSHDSHGFYFKNQSLNNSASFGLGGGLGWTFYDGVKLDAQTASTLAGFDANKNLVSLATSTYPSLTELAYVKGVTSAIQTQLDAKLTATSTNTLTNKRITKRVGSTTSSATPTINTDNYDYYEITALAVDITSFTTNLSGTPTPNQPFCVAITDNGTARAITWGLSFESSGNALLPVTTVAGVRMDVGFRWNSTTGKWRCQGVA